MEATCKLGEKGCWNDGKCRATLNCECKVITNADRIRAMSDEELAWELLVWRFDAFAKAKGDEATLPSSQKTIVAWLKQPARGGENE